MLRALALLAGGMAALGACAGTQKQEQAAERQTRVQANIRIAVSLTEVASPRSLADAAKTLSTNDITGEPAAQQLAAFAGMLWSVLYPDLQNPLPSPATKPGANDLAKALPAESAFFQHIGPALALLWPGTIADPASLQDDLAAADNINGDSVLPPYLQALLLGREDNPLQSPRALYQECLRREPSFYPAKLGLIQTAIQEGRAAADVTALAQYAQELPTPLAVQTETASLFLAAGQPLKAATAAARGLLQDPDSTELLMLRAKAFVAMGDWYEALSILDALLTLAPGNGAALAMKATILFEKAGDPDGAMKILSDVEGKFPGDPTFPELRGRILISRGNTVEGEAALQEALTMDPNRVSTLALLAQASARAGRWQEADAYLQRIPEKEKTAEMQQTGWEVALNLADYDRALALAQALEKSEPGDGALLYRVRTLVAASRTQDASDLATQDLKDAKTPAVRASLYLLRAQAERKAGASQDMVLQDLRSALRENPDDLEALLTIADVLSQAGDNRKALGYLKHAQELSPEDADIRARAANAARLAQPGI
ncbi:MAG TPA: tetratricopeptide repeat protein [Spirochaetia bacterium]|nr:tetratricopeptide repeat protein [Spirochaetia bacterium]